MGTNGIDPALALREREKCKAFPTKKIYKDSNTAWEAAISRTRETKIDISPYACDECGWFHLTSSDKVADKVVPARVGISTTTLKRKTPVSSSAIPIRRELEPEGPILPANFDAKIKVLRTFLKGKKSTTTDEIHEVLGDISKNSLGRCMKRVGWYNTRGRNALWKPESEKKTEAIITPIKKVVAPVTDIIISDKDGKLEESISRHPAGKEFKPDYVKPEDVATTYATGSVQFPETPKFLDWRTLDASKFEAMTVSQLIQTLEQFNLEVRIQAAFIE